MKLDNKSKLLLGGFIIVIFLSYHLAFKKTLALIGEHSDSLEEKELYEHIPMKMAQLSKKEAALDSRLQQLGLGTALRENDLLDFLNEVSSENNVKIVELKAPHLIEEGESQRKTYSITLEGNFQSTLKVIYEIEKNGGHGIVSHLAFEKKTDHRTAKNYLQSLFLLEHLE